MSYKIYARTRGGINWGLCNYYIDKISDDEKTMIFKEMILSALPDIDEVIRKLNSNKKVYAKFEIFFTKGNLISLKATDGFGGRTYLYIEGIEGGN